MRRTWPTWLVPTAVLLAGAVLLVARLGEPADIVFDETYYVDDARSMLDTALEDGFAVHPPLGKWIIAGGIALVGDTPVGWRISGALAGALAAMLTALIVRRLTGRAALGGLAGVLLVLDGVFVVQARTAMLDIHLALFVVLGTWLLLVDRDRADAGATGTRWWLLGAGAAFGAAVAVKWSGAWALVGAGLLLLAWELARLRREGRSVGAAVGNGVGRVALFLGLVPVVVYALTWAPWVAVFGDTTSAPDDAPADATYPIGERLAGLVDHHRKILEFHLNLEAEHPYRSPASTWPLQQRPVVYHYEACTDAGVDGNGEPCVGPPGRTSEIIAVGNLALWWGLLPLLPLLLAGAVRRDRRAGLPLAMLMTQFLPWLVVARPVFSFYAVPLVPFVVIGIAVACDHLDRPARRLGLFAGALAGAGLAAAAATAAGALGGATAATDRVVLAACLGAALGAVTGTFSDRRLESYEGAPVRFRHGSALAVVVALAAVALFGYFAPVWYGLPVPDETVRSRWWFDGWI
jgi:dolichyl-phosphate-mannose--protein O-mannosyl transferase